MVDIPKRMSNDQSKLYATIVVMEREIVYAQSVIAMSHKRLKRAPKWTNRKRLERSV